MKKEIILFLLLYCSVQQGYALDSVLLEENFDNNKAAWYEQKTGDFYCVVADGAYYLDNQAGKSRWLHKDLDFLPYGDDFTIELKIRQASGRSGIGFGLLFAVSKDHKAYKQFLINASGQYKINAHSTAGDRTLVDYQSTKALERGGRYNILRIEKKANTVYYYINGESIYTDATNGRYTNRVAFFMGGKMAIEIDYVKVIKHTSSIKLVDNAAQIANKERLSAAINSPYHELAPIISADGQQLFVCRTNHPDNIGGNDIWETTKDQAGNWLPLQRTTAPLNNEGHNFITSVSTDNNTVLLANAYQADGSAGGNGLSISHRQAEGWSIPQLVPIHDFYNKDHYVSYFLCANNKTLLMSVQRDDSYGEKDLYVSFLQKDNTWSVPLNMGNVVNTFENEANPFLAADNKTLYFVSQGHAGYGKHDIFVSKRLDDTWTNWSTPKNLGPKVNTPGNDLNFYLDAAGKWAYLSSGGDIWRIENPEIPEPTVLIKGTVYNAKTQEPMAVDIQYHNLKEQKLLGQAQSNAVTGAYQIALPAGAVYDYFAQKNGFYALSKAIDLTDLEVYNEQEVDLYLQPIEKGEEVPLNNIFFEFDKAILKPVSYSELNRLYELLHKNTSLRIEIAGYTDAKGTAAYNLQLSQKRANTVANYLINKGIPTIQLTAVGYGERQPLNADNSEVTAQKDRRVTFKILE